MKTRQGIETKKALCYRENKAFQWKLFIIKNWFTEINKKICERNTILNVFLVITILHLYIAHFSQMDSKVPHKLWYLHKQNVKNHFYSPPLKCIFSG